jgi:hypothetical protein
MTIPTFMNTWTTDDVENVRAYWKVAGERNFIQKPVTAQNWYTLEFAK